MAGNIYRYLADDHDRLEDALRRATLRPEEIDLSAYGEFRGGLLRHIGIEEKILLPAAQAARGGKALPMAAKLRSDHGALAALLVPTPSPSIVAAIRGILDRHNAIEEDPGGVYDECEALAAAGADALLERIRNAPEVKLAPYANSPIAFDSLRRALQSAGHEYVIVPAEL